MHGRPEAIYCAEAESVRLVFTALVGGLWSISWEGRSGVASGWVRASA